MNTLLELSEKLDKLNDQYAKLYPAFYMAELKYTNKKAELLMGAMGLGSQPLRDAEVELAMVQTPEYEEYNKLYPELHVLNKQIMIAIQMSKNISNSNWSESR